MWFFFYNLVCVHVCVCTHLCVSMVTCCDDHMPWGIRGQPQVLVLIFQFETRPLVGCCMYEAWEFWKFSWLCLPSCCGKAGSQLFLWGTGSELSPQTFTASTFHTDLSLQLQGNTVSRAALYELSRPRNQSFWGLGIQLSSGMLASHACDSELNPTLI